MSATSTALTGWCGHGEQLRFPRTAIGLCLRHSRGNRPTPGIYQRTGRGDSRQSYGVCGERCITSADQDAIRTPCRTLLVIVIV